MCEAHPCRTDQPGARPWHHAGLKADKLNPSRPASAALFPLAISSASAKAIVIFKATDRFTFAFGAFQRSARSIRQGPYVPALITLERSLIRHFHFASFNPKSKTIT